MAPAQRRHGLYSQYALFFTLLQRPDLVAVVSRKHTGLLMLGEWPLAWLGYLR